MTKFVDDAWMRQHGFAESDWEMGTIGDIVRTLPESQVISIEDDCTLEDAVERFKANGISQMPCTSGGRLSGILTETDLLQLLVQGRSRVVPQLHGHGFNFRFQRIDLLDDRLLLAGELKVGKSRLQREKKQEENHRV
jgi:hypothetical protein